MSDRREICPDGLVTQVREQLGASLREAWAAGLPCRYAAFIHPRRRFGEDGFGIITLRGESLLLTRDLLTSLVGIPVWLPKGRPVAITPESADAALESAADQNDPPPAGTWTEAPAVRRIRVEAREVQTGTRERPEGEAPPGLMDSETERRAVTIMTGSRPAGWPP